MSETIEEVMAEFGITCLQYTDPNDKYDCNCYNAFETDGRVMIIEKNDGCEVQIAGATWVLAWKDFSAKATLFTSILNAYALEENILKSNAVNTLSRPLRERVHTLKTSIDNHSWNLDSSRVLNYNDFQKYYSIFLDCTAEDPYTSETPESIEKFIDEAEGECWATVEFDPIKGQAYLYLMTGDKKILKTHRASYI